MPSAEFDDIRGITDFKSLIKYLRKDLNWPVDEEQVDDLSFEYKAAELGIDDRLAVKIKEIKQLRPLTGNQPWGVFWIKFEKKQLPVVVMRRILSALVKKQRGQKGHQKMWNLPDLMFISATGEGNERGISFAHFQEVDGKPQLRTFAWDVKETHLYYIKNLNLNALRWPADARDADAWRRQWSDAFTVAHREVPRTAERLAKKMAQIASYIREAVELTYRMEHIGGPLHQLHHNLKLDLISDLSEDDFSDMYAQTVTYGLFAARATRSGGFTSTDTTALIEHTNPFLRELLEQMMNQQSIDLDELGVTELTELLGKVNMEAILQDFGRQKRGEDPVIHFYETFMREYDPQQKTKRGEFYTPDPVVSFMVRSVDHLLRTEFNCPDGLLSTISADGSFSPAFLDPATGTGTFLRYIVMVTWDTFYQKYKKLSNAQRKEKWNQYVREGLLPRLYAFELKMSPYTIAHMKVGLTLQEFGFEFRDGERLQIYLTNALQPAHEVARVDTPALAHEAEHSNEIKNNVLVNVMIGNPPYSGHSSNKGDWITNLVADYKRGYPDLNKPAQGKWLQDDYVKFLRFGQWRINKTGAGIVAMITNHAYLDNPTFRGMRQQLLQTFSEIYILDAHGNTKKKEASPDGTKDENVFDIQQGVAICFMVRLPNKTGLAKVFRADLHGTRKYKYEWLLTHCPSMKSVNWEEIYPQANLWLFKKQDISLKAEYDQNLQVSDILNQNGDPAPGIVTTHDEFAISWTKPDSENKVKLLLKTKTESEARELFTLCRQNQWNYLRAKNELQNGKWKKDITDILYRPFDTRQTVFNSNVAVHRRERVMKHMQEKNLGLIMPKRIEIENWRHVLCCNSIVDHVTVSLKTIDYVFPLYLYPLSGGKVELDLFSQLESNRERIPNISPKFIRIISERFRINFILDGTGDLHKTFGPEDVFHYMYAVFHSPAYRSRYAEFLKIDFPRLPLTSNVELFRQLCGLGKELVALHLLEAPALNKPITKFNGKGDNVVAKGHPKYEDGIVLVNASQGFEGVPEDVWEFHIGGYQVCHKWLKDRRGRELTEEDIVHYQKVVVSLRETIRLMGEVDEAIEVHGGWPIK